MNLATKKMIFTIGLGVICFGLAVMSYLYYTGRIQGPITVSIAVLILAAFLITGGVVLGRAQAQEQINKS